MNSLLKRIAEIEFPDSARPMYALNYPPEDFNPLTSWADCGPLIEKYVSEMNLHIRPIDKLLVWSVRCKHDSRAFAQDPDLRTAICKAIIEAHSE